MLDDQNPIPDGGKSAARARPGDARAERPTEPDRRPSPETPEEEQDDGSKADAEKQPGLIRRHPLLIFVSLVALVLLGIGGFLYWQAFVHPYESTDDAFVDARKFTVAPKVGGYVVDVPVTDNQHVEAGAVLAQIDKRDYEVALAQAQAQVESAEASIQNILAQIEGQKAQIDVAKAQVETSKAALQFAKEDADRYQTLAQRGAGTVQQQQSTASTLEQRQASLTSANASVVAAQKQIGSLDAQNASAEASLANAKAQRDQAKLNLGYTTVTAAQSGRVVQLTGAKGQYAQSGQSLSMFVPDDIWVTANFKETQITDMRPGQHVDVEIDSYPDRKITGKVASVQPGSGTAFSLLPAQNATGNYVKVTQRIPVKIVVDGWPDDVAIGPGMSVIPTVRVR